MEYFHFFEQRFPRICLDKVLIVSVQHFILFIPNYRHINFQLTKFRINKIHERGLRLVYKNETFLSFDDLLKRDRSVSIHQKNLQILATEIYKTKMT